MFQYRQEPNESPHGEANCRSRRRYWCVICWRLTCWCKGAGNEVEENWEYNTSVPTEDPGICDDCWVALAGDQNLVALIALDGAEREIDEFSL